MTGAPPAPPARFRDLKVRIVSALIVAAIALLCIWLGGPWIVVLAMVACSAMTLELRSIARYDDPSGGGPVAGYVAAAAGGILAAAIFTPLVGIFVLSFTILLSAGLAPGRAQSLPARIARLVLTLLPAGLIVLGAEIGSPPIWIGGTVATVATVGWLHGRAGRAAPIVVILGTFYIGVAGIAFVALRAVEPYGLLSILWAALVVIAADVGGYFAGRLIGGPKLWPAVSPKKTWAGLGGGVGLAVVVGGIFSGATTGTYFQQVCAVSAIAAALSQGGDLGESALKRHFGVKDAGSLIPGHGGVLDRLDGHMAAILVAAAVTFSRGQPVFVW